MRSRHLSTEAKKNAQRVHFSYRSVGLDLLCQFRRVGTVDPFHELSTLRQMECDVSSAGQYFLDGEGGTGAHHAP
jgi:hypothetical protein